MCKDIIRSLRVNSNQNTAATDYIPVGTIIVIKTHKYETFDTHKITNIEGFDTHIRSTNIRFGHT